MIGRRRVIAAGLALAAVGPGAQAASDPEPLLFTHGPLASNAIGKRFHRPPKGLALPTVSLVGEDGSHRLAELKGQITLVSLWAEWCVPCILEAPDLAALDARYRSRGFRVQTILTGSAKKLDLKGATELLRAHGAVPPLWIEPDGGMQFLNALAVMGKEPNLPCNLLLDPQGQIRGRSFGGAPIDTSLIEMKGGKLTEAAKDKMLASRAASTWATPDADRFVETLLTGALKPV